MRQADRDTYTTHRDMRLMGNKLIRMSGNVFTLTTVNGIEDDFEETVLTVWRIVGYLCSAAVSLFIYS